VSSERQRKSGFLNENAGRAGPVYYFKEELKKKAKAKQNDETLLPSYKSFTV